MTTPSSFPPPPKVRESRFDDWMIRFYKAINSSAGGSSPLSLPFFSVKKYGAKGDGVTDDTLAIQAAGNAMTTAGGGALWFEPGKTYRVWTTTPSTLLSFSSLEGVLIFGNGAEIVTAQTNASFVDVFKLNGCANVTIRDLTFTGSNTTLKASTGERFIDYHNDCRNIAVENCRVYNCRSGLEAAGSPGGTRTKGVRVHNCYFEKVYYPLQPYRTDNLEARYTSVNAGRSYFPTSPCSHHEIWLDSQQGGPFSDCLIKVYAGSSSSVAENTISDINLNYRTAGRYSGSGDAQSGEACVNLEIQQADASTAAGHLRNINVNITADCSSGDQFADLFTMRKFDVNSALDTTTTRGHTIKGLHIKANAINCDNLVRTGVTLFTTESSCNWTGDTAQNITLSAMLAGTPPTDSIYINGQAFSDSTQSLMLHNVNVDGPITYANVSAGRIGKSGVIASNENSSDCEGSWTPGISFGGGTTGITYTIQSGSYTKRGNRVHCTGVIVLSAKGSSTGAAKITGLPFTVRNNNDSINTGSLYFSGVTFTGQFQPLADGNATTIAINQITEAGNASNLTDANFAATSQVRIAITYRVA